MRAGGFSLIELMVVIMLIAIIAMLAAPGMRVARDDRLAFDYARQYVGVAHRASVRAGARGAAHLLLITTGAGRGNIRLFEAVDATAPPAGPNPVSSCKRPGQWAGVSGWQPGSAGPPLSPIIDGVDLDTLGVNVDMNVLSEILVNGQSGVGAVALCYTPGGNVYMGSGSASTGAIDAMRVATPFTGVVEVKIARHDAANNVRGLTRDVIIAGAAAPRIQSQ